jgi:hypothetical protein
VLSLCCTIHVVFVAITAEYCDKNEEHPHYNLHVVYQAYQAVVLSEAHILAMIANHHIFGLDHTNEPATHGNSSEDTKESGTSVLLEGQSVQDEQPETASTDLAIG